MLKVRTALLATSDKRGLGAFAGGLARLGAKLIATGGTAALLRASGLSVTDISEWTGAPELLDGRLKTLHPKVHGGLLFLRDNESHRRAIAEHGIEPIDMVVVNLYPFGAVTSAPRVAMEDALQHIDIGGHSLVRSGAKNYRAVAVVTDCAQYDSLLKELTSSAGWVSERTLGRLAVEAFEYTARYDTAIQAFLGARLTETPGDALRCKN